MAKVARSPDTAGTSKPSITKIFWERLEREGRIDQWKATLAAVQAETGQKFSQAKWAAMKKLGYEGPDQERGIYVRWRAMEQAKAQVSEDNKTEANDSFEAALAKLPLKADRQVELDWVTSHVALTRRARGADKSAPVLITADDILAAAHGPAPSRRDSAPTFR